MARILAIDYGGKRTGIAVTDPLQICANGLDTVATTDLFDFLERYTQAEEVEQFVVGEPLNMDGTPTHNTQPVYNFVKKLKAKYPTIPVALIDERMTSKQAKQIIFDAGVKKKKRRDKSLIDKVSAVVILQDYMQMNNPI